ncbi:MAG: hypothetical protein V3V49_12755 [Candidatus Krumholzibacteria bacterium]
MKSWVLPLLVLVFALSGAGMSPVVGEPVLERDIRPETKRTPIDEPWSINAFTEEIGQTVQRAVSAVKACVRTVVTVAKAVVRAVQLVLVTLVKVIFHLAGAILMSLGKWLFALLLG